MRAASGAKATGGRGNRKMQRLRGGARNGAVRRLH